MLNDINIAAVAKELEIFGRMLGLEVFNY